MGVQSNDLIGTWQIDQVLSLDHHWGYLGSDATLIGTRMSFTPRSELVWDIPAQPKGSPGPSPLTQCQTYEIVPENAITHLLRMAAFQGYTYQFQAQFEHGPAKRSQSDLTQRNMLLLSDSGILIRCQMQYAPSTPLLWAWPKAQERAHQPYDLRGAWADKEAVEPDSQIRGREPRRFSVHGIVLRHAFPSLQWSDPNELSSLSHRSIEILLHFGYGQCFPQDLNLSDLDALIQEIEPISSLVELTQQAQRLRQASRIGRDLNALLSTIIHAGQDVLVALGLDRGRSGNRTKSRHLPRETTVETYIHVIQGIGRSSIKVLVLLLRIFQLYNTVETDPQIHVRERNAFLDALQSSTVHLSALTRSMLSGWKSIFSTLDAATRQEVATRLWPEVEQYMDQGLIMIKEIREIVVSLIASRRSGAQSRRTGEGSILEQESKTANMSKLEHCLEYISLLSTYLSQERELLIDMDPSAKVQLISKVIEELAADLPLISLKVEHFLDTFARRVQEGSFKFCFASLAAIVGYWLEQVAQGAQRPLGTEGAGSLTQQLLSEVQQSNASPSEGDDDDIVAFLRHSLRTLGLGQILSTVSQDRSRPSQSTHHISFPPTTPLTEEHVAPAGPEEALVKGDVEPVDELSPPDSFRLMSIPICEGFFTPLSASQSELARNMDDLWQGMVAAAHAPRVSQTRLTPRARDLSGVIDPDTATDLVLAITDSDGPDEEFRCHRVVLMSRCRYFQRALTSGMREQTERRIHLKAVPKGSFGLFLRYLYSGLLELDQPRVRTKPSGDDESGWTTSDEEWQDPTLERFVQLLQLSDRFEVEGLRLECEKELAERIHIHNVLRLYEIAHDFNALALQDQCLQTLASCQKQFAPKDLLELDPVLQEELILLWRRPRPP